MNAAERIERGAIGGGENYSRGADGGADSSWRHDAHAGGSGGLIACAGDDGSASGEAGGGRAFSRNFAANFGGFV